MPPKLTAVVPVKLAPLITTDVPVPPVVGVKELIFGYARNVKLPDAVAVPKALVTDTLPLAAFPTVAVI